MADNSTPVCLNDSPTLACGIQWFLLSSLAITVLTLVAVHAPHRIKALGLFALVFGVSAGWLIAHIANFLQFTRRVPFVCGAGILILCGLIGMAAESHRLHAGAIKQQYSADPTGFLKNQLDNPDDSTNTDQLQDYIEEASQERAKKLVEMTGFGAYLEYRTSPGHTSSGQLRGWPAPWPWVLFVSELLLGTVGGVIVAHRSLRVESPMDEDSALN